MNMKIAIKLGTSAIFDSKNNKIKKGIIKSLVQDTKKLISNHNEVIIISSGAVGCGKSLINGANSLGLKQAQASVGQPRLMSIYEKYFSKIGLHIAQFLLTSNDLKNKGNLQNIKNTYNHLIDIAVPIINENDTTTTEELSFGDNDLLSTEIVIGLDFDVLIVLTELGALIKDGEPVINSKSFDVGYYDSIKIKVAGFGGLKSKLNSAKRLINKNKTCIIGKAGDNLKDILDGKVVCTKFNP